MVGHAQDGNARDNLKNLRRQSRQLVQGFFVRGGGKAACVLIVRGLRIGFVPEDNDLGIQGRFVAGREGDRAARFVSHSGHRVMRVQRFQRAIDPDLHIALVLDEELV